ncbi:UDP-glycosyltransferase 86A1-like [Olea europaea subsp. europaea]|uniref:Glycosyltransferase n=1 Tax=Olea europaea subsp. europaea TaxID=158383 RepID=A0A8S0PY14_OLEEU|nr:UDP-glycosyltransferase 86A1-like [Olea europaea subsp. europaea]
MAEIESSRKPHAIMISFHLQGHIIPFVNLAIKLASKGVTVTFVHLEFIHHQIIKSQYDSTQVDFFSEARNSGLDIHYTTISDGFPVEFDRSRNLDQYGKSFLLDFPTLVDEFVGKILHSHSSSSYNYFLVADTLCVWTAKIARKYHIVNVSFWTEPALVFSLYYHLDLLRKNGHVPANGLQENINYIPGIQSINTKDFMSYLQGPESTIIHTIIFIGFEEVKSADFIICNTVQELEAEAVLALKENQPFYAIGPICPTDFSTNTVPRSLLSESDCTEWLKTKSPGSVLYVSFGSLAKTDEHVILEIAEGLFLSEVNFLWVLRPGIVSYDDDDEILTVGFKNRIKDQGLIVPWCNQNLVLSNPAIGGFLTHCGWNSILESIWWRVPMICYPLFTDQITNRKLVVDDWKIGINLCDGLSISREEVAEKIKILMGGGKSNGIKEEMNRAREIMQTALNGSSERNFDQFLKDLTAKFLKK